MPDVPERTVLGEKRHHGRHSSAEWEPCDVDHDDSPEGLEPPRAPVRRRKTKAKRVDPEVLQTRLELAAFREHCGDLTRTVIALQRQVEGFEAAAKAIGPSKLKDLLASLSDVPEIEPQIDLDPESLSKLLDDAADP
jgi:hypothetical protein